MAHPEDPALEAPVAPVEPTVHELHGVVRVDDYFWLRDAERAETVEYLAAERAFYDARMAHARPLRDSMFAEMTRRTVPTDRSVSWRDNGSVYYTQTVPGKEYEQFLRSDAEEFAAELLLDENILAGDADYFSLGERLVSPDGSLLAYSVDFDGSEFYTVHLRDLTTGEDLADEIARTYYGAAWSADSSTLFYVAVDHAHRPHQVWRHRVGTPTADDVLVYSDPDERFEVHVEGSRSGGMVIISSLAKDTSESWLVAADRPDEPPVVVEPRRPGVLYFVSHAPLAGGAAGTDDSVNGEALLIVTNDDAQEFRLMSTPVRRPGRASWTELIAEDPAERLAAADVFAGYVVLTVRRDGAPLLRILRRDGAQEAVDIQAVDVHPGIEAGTIQLGRNDDYDVESVLVSVESYTQPTAWYDVDLATGTRTLRRRREVPGYDPELYVSATYHVEAADGVLVPVTVVRREDTPLDGTAPCLLYAYGAYEFSYEPEFDVGLPSLLDRGVVFAHAHVRGGGEGGRRWWLDGSLDRKQNTFGDFVAVADALADGLVDPAGLVARGLSAGGLLMGAAYSQAPRRWRGVVAEVPFVDVVTTMLDETIPLTAQEWDEWGDPRRPDDFAWMLEYSPYDNPPPLADRPRLLVTAALHDPRVMYWEPAKWVAKLRATGSTGAVAGDLLLRMELGAGAHVGPSGRFGHLLYEAEVYAWVLDTLGLSTLGLSTLGR
jgi:oligopeptidase B